MKHSTTHVVTNLRKLIGKRAYALDRTIELLDERNAKSVIGRRIQVVESARRVS